MAKRKIIRHLEFYGYPDQNAFATAGNVSIDLSDIREKNREQDEELDNLDDEKVDKSEFNHLSGVVDTFVDLQTQFNDVILGKVNNNTSAITAIHDWIEEFSDDISGYTDVDERLDNVESGVTQLSGNVADLSGTVESMEDELDKKLDKEDADDIYAKKDETYTKDDVDRMLSSYTEWDCESIAECVSGSGFITKDDADEMYVTKDEFSAITDDLSNLASLNERIDTVSGNLDTFSASTNARMGNLETRYNTFETNVTRKVNTISATVESFENDILGVKRNVRDLQDEMVRKASKAEFDELVRRVENDETEISKKVDKTDFDTYKDIVSDKFDDIDNKKADRSELSAITGDISGVTELINAEREARETSDAIMSGMISSVESDIEALREVDSNYSDRLDILESGLTKEIEDRKQADIDLIGTENDSPSDDTIWGAKKYAVSQRNLAISSATTYTNNQVDILRSEIGDFEDHFDQELSKKANIDYVNETALEITSEIDGKIDTAVSSERNRAQEVERSIQNQAYEAQIEARQAVSGMTHLADRMNAITVWDGVNPAEYTNEGNGVLDVLHREFHQFKQIFDGIGEGTITSNRYEIAFGSYNKTNTGEDDADKTIFSIGVGIDDENRENAIELRKNGDLYLWIEGEFMNVNKLLGQLAHETYYDTDDNTGVYDEPVSGGTEGGEVTP